MSFSLTYIAGREDGRATMVNLSRSGALLETGDHRPPLAERIHVTVELAPGSMPELSGHVARHTDRGFAIEFSEMPLPLVEFRDERNV